MPGKAAGGSPGAKKNRRSETAGQATPDAPLKASASKPGKSRETPQQQALALSESAEVENIRRANLHVLTSRNGSKARLGVVMEMIGSNMAHRLYGKKRMDSVEANRFTEKLGLPMGWLDTPRSEAEIPESVSLLLMPPSRGRVSDQRHEPPAASTNDGVSEKPADAKRRARRARRGAPNGMESPSPVSADVAEEKEGIVLSPEVHAGDSHDDPAGRSLDESVGEAPASSPATGESLPASIMPRRNPVQHPLASVTSLDNLPGIEPIAAALLKTLAGKARTGRLDELKALELLQQAILL